MENNFALIDGDSICYICSKDNLMESIDATEKLISNIVAVTNTNGYVIVLSKGPYFRSNTGNYKDNRKSKSHPKYTKLLKEYLSAEHNAYYFQGLEADDLVIYFKYKFKTPTVCSIDKDVLKSCIGKNYDYKKNIFIETTEESSEEFLFLQCLMGDAADGVQGLKNVGIKGAEKIIKEFGALNGVVSAYIKTYGIFNGILELAKSIQQLKMLTTDDEILEYFEVLPELDLEKHLITIGGGNGFSEKY